MAIYSISSLPLDILRTIFAQFPTRALIFIIRLVCRKWSEIAFSCVTSLPASMTHAMTNARIVHRLTNLRSISAIEATCLPLASLEALKSCVRSLALGASTRGQSVGGYLQFTLLTRLALLSPNNDIDYTQIIKHNAHLVELVLQYDSLQPESFD